jgi:hypothetical protein
MYTPQWKWNTEQILSTVQSGPIHSLRSVSRRRPDDIPTVVNYVKKDCNELHRNADPNIAFSIFSFYTKYLNGRQTDRTILSAYLQVRARYREK